MTTIEGRWRARRNRGLAALGAAALVLGLATAGMAGTASATPGGNSDAAKACQKDGYMSLARTESPRVAFTSSDECTSYAAEGGTLVPLQTVNMRAFEEACYATGAAFLRYSTENSGSYTTYYCSGRPGGHRAALLAACTEMGGTSFSYRLLDGGETDFYSDDVFSSSCTVPNS